MLTIQNTKLATIRRTWDIRLVEILIISQKSELKAYY